MVILRTVYSKVLWGTKNNLWNMLKCSYFIDYTEFFFIVLEIQLFL